MRKALSLIALVAAVLFGLAPMALASTVSSSPPADLFGGLWSALAGAVPMLAPLAAGPALALTAEAAKRVPAVPFDPKTAAGMRLAVALLSLAAGVGLAWLDGSLVAYNWQSAGAVLVDALVIYAAAVATHDHALKPAT